MGYYINFSLFTVSMLTLQHFAEKIHRLQILVLFKVEYGVYFFMLFIFKHWIKFQTISFK